MPRLSEDGREILRLVKQIYEMVPTEQKKFSQREVKVWLNLDTRIRLICERYGICFQPVESHRLNGTNVYPIFDGFGFMSVPADLNRADEICVISNAAWRLAVEQFKAEINARFEQPIESADERTEVKKDNICKYAKRCFGYQPSVRIILDWTALGWLRCHELLDGWHFSHEDLRICCEAALKRKLNRDQSLSAEGSADIGSQSEEE